MSPPPLPIGGKLFATTARERDQAKPVLVTPEAFAAEAKARIASDQQIGILFGAERTGLTNEEVSLADAIVTFPVNPAFPVAQSRAVRVARLLRVVQGGRRAERAPFDARSMSRRRRRTGS